MSRTNFLCCRGAGGHSPAKINVFLSHRSGISNFLRLSAKNLKTKVCNLPVGLLGSGWVVGVGGGGEGWILKHILCVGTLWLQLILFLDIVL